VQQEESLAITVRLAPADAGCDKPWATVLYQRGTRMTHAAREAAESTPKQTFSSTKLAGVEKQAAVIGLLVALNWEHPSEKTADPTR
jgi:hypothetical protein